MKHLFPSFRYLKELYYAVIIIIAISGIGIVGYMMIEDYSFTEALYMTVITVSTVGFKEVRDLTDGGRYFTTGLILVSFGTFAYTLSTVSKYLITGTFQRYYKKFLMDNQISKLEGHVVLCGAGRNGMEALHTLRSNDQKVVVIEKSTEIVEDLQDEGVFFIEGDATEEEALITAGIDRASALITSLPKDTDNVFVVLTARELNSSIRIVSRCTYDSTESKLKIAGANAVILPDKVGGARMAGFIINHNLNRFIDTVAFRERDRGYLSEINSSKLPFDNHVQTVGGMLNSLESKCKVVGIMSPDFEYIMNPPDEFQISADSQIFFFGNPDQIADLNRKIIS